ncbi:hypothetical protein GpartN1_g6236.t1 [Galdieria partita]|uniref:CYTH domain-containing protein n=1 Tax=Galdieria partita TaxID=83374 RepID=A0A9C7Q219_9RHOD|nr:hypothetical protein GpartN1_g6236.t1 [Galdieria partita]
MFHCLFLSPTLWCSTSFRHLRKTCSFAYRKRKFLKRPNNFQCSTRASFDMSLIEEGDKRQRSNVEIERKFLVVSTKYREKFVKKYSIRQGYLFASKDKSVRVRCTDDAAFLTIKGETFGMKRKEFEYSIPQTDAEQLLDSLCLRPQIEKTRYLVEEKGFVWEVDEFLGDNVGLVVAEVELKDEEVQVELPDWVGKEVTEDTRFYNSVLFQRPFCSWSEEERQKINS